jgi:hypothetical protein
MGDKGKRDKDKRAKQASPTLKAPSSKGVDGPPIDKRMHRKGVVTK